MPMRALLGSSLALVLVACGAEAEDGIFDPTAGGPDNGSGMASGPGDDGSETGESTAADTTSAATSETTGPSPGTTDEGDSTGVTDQGTCPEAVGPGGYTCPEGFTPSTGDGWARCMVEGVSLPAAASLSPYCQYLDMGYLGYSWSLTEDGAYACPPEARYAPTGQTGYCLWEDFVPPALAEADCNSLVATGDFGFRWPCPPA